MYSNIKWQISTRQILQLLLRQLIHMFVLPPHLPLPPAKSLELHLTSFLSFVNESVFRFLFFVCFQFGGGRVCPACGLQNPNSLKRDLAQALNNICTIQKHVFVGKVFTIKKFMNYMKRNQHTNFKFIRSIMQDKEN